MSHESNEPPTLEPPRTGVSRRGFLRGVGAAAIVTDGLLARAADEPQSPQPEVDPAAPGAIVPAGPVKLRLQINGKQRVVVAEPRTTLLSALRDRLEPPITGPKLVCDAGACGACTVLLNGKNVYSCSVLAIDAVGKQITTVEGLGTPDHMSPVQAAFVEKDAMMCGFCTSGFVTTITALLQKNPNPTMDQVKEGCKGNFCRCGTYPHVFAAALSAAKHV